MLVASADRGGRYLTVKAVASVAVPADRVLELWALPEGRDPRSLGLVPASGVARIPLAAPAGVLPSRAFRRWRSASSRRAARRRASRPGPVLYTGGIQNLY